MTILGCELNFGIGDELVIEIIFYKIDCTSSKATTHDAASGHTILSCDVIEEVKFFTRYFIFFAQTFMSLEHLLPNGFVIAFLKCIADSKYAVFLTENEMCTLVIFFADFGSNLFQLVPCTITERFKFSLRMLGSNVLYHILTAVATIVIGASCKFMLYL